jgi:hypothetical protein
MVLAPRERHSRPTNKRTLPFLATVQGTAPLHFFDVSAGLSLVNVATPGSSPPLAVARRSMRGVIGVSLPFVGSYSRSLIWGWTHGPRRLFCYDEWSCSQLCRCLSNKARNAATPCRTAPCRPQSDCLTRRAAMTASDRDNCNCSSQSCNTALGNLARGPSIPGTTVERRWPAAVGGLYGNSISSATSH